MRIFLKCINTHIGLPVFITFDILLLSLYLKIKYLSTRQINKYTLIQTFRNIKKYSNNLAHTMNMPNHALFISIYSYN